MLLLLTKLTLAPLIVMVASVLANRLGPQRGGFFIGLPTTSLPFMLVIWMASGTGAALHAAMGGLTGQVTCALFCVAYARTAPKLRPLLAMASAAVVAVAIGFTTLGLQNAPLLVALSALVAIVGLATWPRQEELSAAVRGRRYDIPLRMLVAGLTVVVTSGIEPRVGATLAGALASLPMISMVVCPAVHAAQGSGHAVAMVRGTIGSIPGTAAYLCMAILIAPHDGLPLGILAGVAVIPLVNKLVAVLGGLRRRPAVAA